VPEPHVVPAIAVESRYGKPSVPKAKKTGLGNQDPRPKVADTGPTAGIRGAINHAGPIVLGKEKTGARGPRGRRKTPLGASTEAGSAPAENGKDCWQRQGYGWMPEIKGPLGRAEAGPPSGGVFSSGLLSKGKGGQDSDVRFFLGANRGADGLSNGGVPRERRAISGEDKGKRREQEGVGRGGGGKKKANYCVFLF